MANDVTINVRANDHTREGFASARRGAEDLGDAATGVGNNIANALSIAAKSAVGFVTSMLSGSAATLGLGAEATAATGGINLLVGALLIAAGAAASAVVGLVALAPILYAAGGAAGAAATALAGLGATFAVLKIGLGGISDAWTAYGQQAARGGGRAVDTSKQQAAAARQVETATRSLVDAKRAEKDAAEAVNRAREDEVLRLRDVGLALRGATLDQKDAAKDLADAKQRLANTMTGDFHFHGDIADQLAEGVQRAQLAYETATNKVSDLSKEQRAGARNGVDGSDQVRQALERQTQAVERVKAAQEALADAQRNTAVSAGGAGGAVNLFNRAMEKLSPNARRLVLELIDVSKRFDVIKRQVQDRLFAGFDTTVEKLADRWLPKLGPMLGGIADHLNGFGKGLARALGDPRFISGIETALHAFGGVIDDIGAGVNAMVDAFGRVAGDSAQPLRIISGFIRDIFVHFDNWIKAADKSGKLQSFMNDAANSLKKMFDIGKTTFKILGQLVDILFPGSKAASGGMLDGVQKALTKVSDWLADKKNQQQLTDFIDGLGELIGQVLAFGKWATATAKVVSLQWHGITHTVDIVRNAFGNAFGWIVSHASSMVGWFAGLPGRINRALHGVWDGLTSGFKAALNWIIGKWNSLHFSLPEVDFLGMHLGGGTVGMPTIPYLASGGISQGLAMVGEHGRELVRTPRGSTVLSHGDTERALAGGGTTAVRLFVDPSRSSGLMRALVEGLRAEIRGQGGNVQQVLGVAGR